MLIDTIDWDVLAERMNTKRNTQLSFKGSSARYNSLDNSVDINLSVSRIGEEKMIHYRTEDGNRYYFYKDSNGRLAYRPSKTSIPIPPNPQSIQISTIVLYNIISDYIEPFLNGINTN